MPSFNTLLMEGGIEPGSCKLVRHKTEGPDGRTPYTVWRNDPAALEFYQSIQKRPVFNRQWLASFIGTPSSETLFIGLYRVSGPEPNRDAVTCPVMGSVFQPGEVWVYGLVSDSQLADMAGRLIIDWGPGALAWRQNADAQPKRIVELRRQFQEPDFPGFPALHIRLDELRNVYPGWRAALSSQRGVYLLAFDDGQQYVGSATANMAFWQRWKDYLENGHGGNAALRGRDARDAWFLFWKPLDKLMRERTFSTPNTCGSVD